MKTSKPRAALALVPATVSGLSKVSRSTHTSDFDAIPEGTDIDVEISLRISRDEFVRTKNPVLVIEAFLAAVKGGGTAPKWVTYWLCDKFDEWHKANGLKSLEKIMGLTPRAGQEPPMKLLLIEERNEILGMEMARWISLKATTAEAAHMVAEKLSRNKSWNQSGWKIDAIGAESILKLWKARWRRRYSPVIKEYGPLSPENLKKFVASYPPHSVPARFN